MSTRRKEPPDDDFWKSHYEKLFQAGRNRFTTWLECYTASQLHRNQSRLADVTNNAALLTSIVDENYQHVCRAPSGKLEDVIQAERFDPRKFQQHEVRFILETAKSPAENEFWREQIKRRIYGASWIGLDRNG